MTAVIYARYSSDNQREESIEGQIRECTAYAEKNGITVIKHYIDRAFSAKTDNRPEFQQELHLDRLPMRIECFDNSNIQGSDPVAGCVVFIKGKPSKKDYRKYNIKTVEGPDDYASMKEVVKRRYQRTIEENAPLPDLLITDGGKGESFVSVRWSAAGNRTAVPMCGVSRLWQVRQWGCQGSVRRQLLLQRSFALFRRR